MALEDMWRLSNTWREEAWAVMWIEVAYAVLALHLREHGCSIVTRWGGGEVREEWDLTRGLARPEKEWCE